MKKLKWWFSYWALSKSTRTVYWIVKSIRFLNDKDLDYVKCWIQKAQTLRNRKKK